MRQLKIDRTITPKNEAALHRYYNEVEKLTMISPQEEAELAGKIRMGDRAALNRLVSANLRFVISVAKKYQNMGLPFSDLIAEGNLGLIRAAELFDATKGFKFISYAVWWIRQSILFALSQHMRTIRISANLSLAITELRELHDRLEQQLERRPTEGELAELMEKYDPKEPLLQNLFGRNISSLDSAAGEDGSTLLEQLDDVGSLAPDSYLQQSDMRGQLKRCLSVLSSRERLVITESYGLNPLGQERTVMEISGMIGTTKDTVSRIRKMAMVKLKAFAEREGAER